MVKPNITSVISLVLYCNSNDIENGSKGCTFISEQSLSTHHLTMGLLVLPTGRTCFGVWDARSGMMCTIKEAELLSFLVKKTLFVTSFLLEAFYWMKNIKIKKLHTQNSFTLHKYDIHRVFNLQKLSFNVLTI